MYLSIIPSGIPWWLSGEEYALSVQEMQERRVRSLGQEDPLEEEMVTHASILAWRIPWMGEPDEL